MYYNFMLIIIFTIILFTLTGLWSPLVGDFTLLGLARLTLLVAVDAILTHAFRGDRELSEPILDMRFLKRIIR